MLEMGCWTPVERYSGDDSAVADVHVAAAGGRVALRGDDVSGSAGLLLPGLHNAENAAAAVLAARHAGVSVAKALEALEAFHGVKRRLELRGVVDDIRVYDDFAHHPTAIRRTLDAVRETATGRVLAVLEPRSNSMKLGAHRDELAAALAPADCIWALQPADLPWRLDDVLNGVRHCTVADDIGTIVAGVCATAEPGDQVVIMSNGSFGGIHEQLCHALAERAA